LEQQRFIFELKQLIQSTLNFEEFAHFFKNQWEKDIQYKIEEMTNKILKESAKVSGAMYKKYLRGLKTKIVDLVTTVFLDIEKELELYIKKKVQDCYFHTSQLQQNIRNKADYAQDRTIKEDNHDLKKSS